MAGIVAGQTNRSQFIVAAVAGSHLGEDLSRVGSTARESNLSSGCAGFSLAGDIQVEQRFLDMIDVVI